MRQQLSWIEYLATNQRVGGSNPSWRANLHQLHFQGYYSSSVLETVNKIIYHTAEQVQLLHCDNIHFVFRLIVSINALASLRSLTPTQSDVAQLYQQYSMYTRSAECCGSELRLVSRWFAVNRRLLFLSRVAYTMFSELMRSYLGCRSSLTMVGIQFVLSLRTGGEMCREFTLHISYISCIKAASY